MKHLFFSFLCCLMTVMPMTAQTMLLGEHEAFLDLTPNGGYATLEFVYSDVTIIISSANRQGQTVTDCPVVKSSYVYVTANDSNKYISSISFTFKRWSSDNKVMPLDYTMDSVNYLYSGVTSSISDSLRYPVVSLPANNKGARLDMSATSKKAGIYSCTVTLADRTDAPLLMVSADKLSMGEVVKGNSDSTIEKQVIVTGANLSSSVSIALEGPDYLSFSIDTTLLTPINGTVSPTSINVLFAPADTGVYHASLVVTAQDSLRTVVALDGTCVLPPTIGGDGTEETPFSTYDVLMMNNPDSVAWVEGYIVGVVESGLNGHLTNVTMTTTSKNTNLALAPTAGCTDLLNMIPIQLPTGSIRDALNLASHPENKGKLVQLKGTLQAYFSTPGLKNVIAYKIEGGTVGVDNVVEEPELLVFSGNGFIDMVGESTSVLVMNVLGTLIYQGEPKRIDSLEAGLYIVKANQKVYKVVVE